MVSSSLLDQFDDRFVQIYEQARDGLVEAQKAQALLIVESDEMRLYHAGKPGLLFDGMQPLAYNRLKSIGHAAMAVFCLLHDVTGRTALPKEKPKQIADYAKAIKAVTPALDASEDVREGRLPRPVTLLQRGGAFVGTAQENRQVLHAQLAAFAREVQEDINLVMAGAARAQLDACHERVTQIRKDILSDDEWAALRVLVLGAYMARQGELFLQYFARVLHTPEQGDRRVVYFEGDDMDAALARLGTVMLDSHASKAIFDEYNRLHRDVLADETARYLDTLVGS